MCHYEERTFCHFMPDRRQDDAGQTAIPKSPPRKIVSRVYKSEVRIGFRSETRVIDEKKT